MPSKKKNQVICETIKDHDFVLNKNIEISIEDLLIKYDRFQFELGEPFTRKQDVKDLRQKLNMSQLEFSEVVDIKLSKYKEIEENFHRANSKEAIKILSMQLLYKPLKWGLIDSGFGKRLLFNPVKSIKELEVNDLLFNLSSLNPFNYKVIININEDSIDVLDGNSLQVSQTLDDDGEYYKWNDVISNKFIDDYAMVKYYAKIYYVPEIKLNALTPEEKISLKISGKIREDYANGFYEYREIKYKDEKYVVSIVLKNKVKYCTMVSVKWTRESTYNGMEFRRGYDYDEVHADLNRKTAETLVAEAAEREEFIRNPNKNSKRFDETAWNELNSKLKNRQMNAIIRNGGLDGFL